MIMSRNIEDLQPSQLYISSEKLNDIYSWLPEKIDSYDPIPIKLLDDHLVITDGHTRLYALLKMGYKTVRVEWDKDLLNWDAYRICVQWCLDNGINSVRNLDGRILNKSDYNVLWINRCKKMHKNLVNINIRRGNIDDMAVMQELFVNTIRESCNYDYSEDQINAWISSVENEDRWVEKINNQYLLVAEIDQQIVGYASLENGNYLAFMYVHYKFLRKGIANILYSRLEAEVKKRDYTSIFSDVSITAKPFFQKNGFEIIKENKNIIRGVELINYHMKKFIS